MKAQIINGKILLEMSVQNGEDWITSRWSAHITKRGKALVRMLLQDPSKPVEDSYLYVDGHGYFIPSR